MKLRWLKLVAVTLALAGILHVVIVMLIPIGIMRTVMSRVAATAGVNRIVAQPLPTETSRSIVKPSPDLLYALCVFDVSAGPVRVSITPPTTYWSVSVFDTNTDNVFKLNAADVPDQATAHLVLGLAADAPRIATTLPAAKFVPTADVTGVILARILVLDKTNMSDALAAQRSVTCEPVGDRR